MEGREEKTEPEGKGDGVEPESGGNVSPKMGGLAPDFDFKFGGIEATAPNTTPRRFAPRSGHSKFQSLCRQAVTFFALPNISTERCLLSR